MLAAPPVVLDENKRNFTAHIIDGARHHEHRHLVDTCHRLKARRTNVLALLEKVARLIMRL